MGIIEDGKRQHLHNKGISRGAADAVKHYGDFSRLDSELWRQAPQEPGHSSDDNFSVLHFQAGKGNLAEVERLLATGHYNINQQRHKNGNTALHEAVLGGHADVVEALLHAGADINIRNGGNYSAYALAREQRDSGVLAAFERHEASQQLIAAAESGNLKKANELMARHIFTDRRLLEDAQRKAREHHHDDIADAVTQRIAALPTPKPAAHHDTSTAAADKPAGEPKKGNWLLSLLGFGGVAGVASVLTGGFGLMPLVIAGGVGMAIFAATYAMSKPAAKPGDAAAIPSAIPEQGEAQAAATGQMKQLYYDEMQGVPDIKTPTNLPPAAAAKPLKPHGPGPATTAPQR